MPSFKARIPSPKPLPSSGKLFGTENQQGNRKNDDQVRWLKQSLKHRNLPRTTLLDAYTLPDGYKEVKPPSTVSTYASATDSFLPMPRAGAVIEVTTSRDR